jgi:tRNA nucleotidyltransferase (CCA-adding enzyme)
MLDNIIEVLNKIESYDYKAYIVGGYVRDYYLGLPNKDVDICTNARINDLEKILSNIISKNERYGSLVINYKGIKIEITTFRKELDYENNRKPINIECVSTIEEDVKRRDFTINSLYMDKNKNIIDLVDGKKDIDNKVIRVVGDANYKIKEDALKNSKSS